MRRRSFDIIFTLALFALYSTTALGISAVGSYVYRNTTDTMAHDYDRRTSVHYVAQKIRSADRSTTSLRIEQLGEGDALVITQPLSGGLYSTWLYVSDGYLYELLVGANEEPHIDYGQAIMPMQQIDAEIWGSDKVMLRVTFTLVDGMQSDLHISLRSISHED